MILRVLVEGTSDVPVVRETLVRGLGRVQGTDFQVFWHKGKGRLPTNPMAAPAPRDETLLGQLAAKLRAFGRSDPGSPVLVVVDADQDNCLALKASLTAMLGGLPHRPREVIFRIAVEEVESWFIADTAAVQRAYPAVNLGVLMAIAPDAVVGAWEQLADALGLNSDLCTGADKEDWAKAISPHLELAHPPSPSFATFIRALEQLTGVSI
jgi:hypothetical protein